MKGITLNSQMAILKDFLEWSQKTKSWTLRTQMKSSNSKMKLWVNSSETQTQSTIPLQFWRKSKILGLKRKKSSSMENLTSTNRHSLNLSMIKSLRRLKNTVASSRTKNLKRFSRSFSNFISLSLNRLNLSIKKRKKGKSQSAKAFSA